MSYIDANLLPGERVTYRARLHWAVYLAPIVYLAFGFVLLLFFVGSRNDPLLPAFGFGSVLLFLAAISTTIKVFIIFNTTEFALTDRRVIAKTGFIRRRSLELLLTKVESIRIDQPILGRILDFGTVIVTGTGGTQESFRSIAAPMILKQKVNAQLLPQ